MTLNTPCGVVYDADHVGLLATISLNIKFEKQCHYHHCSSNLYFASWKV